ncbi:MAG: hypothetical protein H6703_08475 [Myxococcales bacterium]|nr:hypothetical protein [Myxococcales bacterium]
MQEARRRRRGGVHGCGSCGIELIIDPSTPHRLLIEMNLDIWLRTAPAGRTLAEASLELAFPSGRAQIIDLDPGDWGPGKSIRQTIESPARRGRLERQQRALLKDHLDPRRAVEHEQYKIRRIAGGEPPERSYVFEQTSPARPVGGDRSLPIPQHPPQRSAVEDARTSHGASSVRSGFERDAIELPLTDEQATHDAIRIRAHRALAERVADGGIALLLRRPR